MADLMIDQLAQGDLRSGNLEVRLAESSAEVDAAQALRYRVFDTEMAARPSAEMAACRRDFDSYDRVCDHLLVIDHNLGSGPEGVVGTYRLIRRSAADDEHFGLPPLRAAVRRKRARSSKAPGARSCPLSDTLTRARQFKNT